MINLERINDILGYKNRRIYQDDKFLSFSLDSIILANYSTIRKKDNNIIDVVQEGGTKNWRWGTPMSNEKKI